MCTYGHSPRCLNGWTRKLSAQIGRGEAWAVRAIFAPERASRIGVRELEVDIKPTSIAILPMKDAFGAVLSKMTLWSAATTASGRSAIVR